MDTRLPVLLQGVGERAPPESQLLKATLNGCLFTGLFRGHHKNLLFISLQALRPMAMSLLVVFWSSPWQYPSMAFVLENKEVFVRLGANAPWCPVDSHQAVSEPPQAWTWGGRCVVTQAEAKQTLRTTERSYCWIRGLDTDKLFSLMVACFS